MDLVSGNWLDAAQWLRLLHGASLSAQLALLVLLPAFPLGLMWGLALQLGRKRWSWPLHLLALAVRNTPLMVQLLFWYLAVGSLLPESWMLWLNLPPERMPWLWPAFEAWAAWAALVLYASVFIAEELRAGLLAVDGGQWEAARAQGLRRWQALRWVVLPQALRAARAALIGQVLNTIKNTSLAMAIGVMELSYRARQIEAETLLAFQSFAAATLLYLALIWLVQAVLLAHAPFKSQTERAPA